MGAGWNDWLAPNRKGKSLMQKSDAVESLGGYHTLKRAAEIVEKSHRTLQLYIRFRRVPFITVGGTAMVRLDDLRTIPSVGERLDAMKAEMTD